MNKLFNALTIINHIGWKAQLGKSFEKEFNFLFERSKEITDEDLTDAELELIKLIDDLLNENVKDKDINGLRN